MPPTLPSSTQLLTRAPGPNFGDPKVQNGCGWAGDDLWPGPPGTAPFRVLSSGCDETRRDAPVAVRRTMSKIAVVQGVVVRLSWKHLADLNLVADLPTVGRGSADDRCRKGQAGWDGDT
jgi:hypothetical protein